MSYPQTKIKESNGYKLFDRVDVLAGDTWFEDFATIIYFDEESGLPVCEMNYPGHDGCRWAHQRSFENIRHYTPSLVNEG